MMKRREDWSTRLCTTIENYSSKDFKWGNSDCCLFICDCVEVMTGVDLAKDFRGRYSSKFEAYKLVKDLGFNSLEDLADSKLERINIKLARRGDVVMKEGGFGVCLGKTSCFLTLGGTSLSTNIRTLDCELSWRIG